MSIPFLNEEFVFTQPDGTDLRVRGSGDEHNAVFETLDGYTVVKNPISGFYEYSIPMQDGEDLKPSGIHANAMDPALLNIRKNMRPRSDVLRTSLSTSSGLSSSPMRWETRRQNRRAALRAAAASNINPAPPQRQTVGDFVGLCLLVQFPDVTGTITRQEVERYCNTRGYGGFGNKGSVFDLFHDNSCGKLRLTHVVAPYYTAKNKREYYTNPKVSYGIRARELIKEAIDQHIKDGFDFSTLSVDDEGYVFATSVFYAGSRINNWSEGLWPHAHHLASPLQLAPGRSAYDYQITDMTDQLRLGTFCHELGHLLCDFPDLYDKRAFVSSGIGKFCLMCAGGNADQNNPAQISAYLKYLAGWSDDVWDLEPGKDYTLGVAKNQFGIFRKNDTEYFLIENRSKSGRDEALPDEGLAIWHIDELGDNSEEGMKPSKHFECSLIQADGTNDLEKGLNQGDDDDLFHAALKDEFSGQTKPDSKWWDGTESGLHVTKISAAGPVMTFTVPPVDGKGEVVA